MAGKSGVNRSHKNSNGSLDGEKTSRIAERSSSPASTHSNGSSSRGGSQKAHGDGKNKKGTHKRANSPSNSHQSGRSGHSDPGRKTKGGHSRKDGRSDSPASVDSRGSRGSRNSKHTLLTADDDLDADLASMEDSLGDASVGFEPKPMTPKAETPEEREARIEAEKEERRQQFIRENFTFLNFKMLDGSSRRIQLDRLSTYMAVQTEVARYNQKGYKMFHVIDPESSERISSHNFVEGPEWNIVESFRAKIPKFYPRLPTKWDFTKYHGKPPNWVDPVIAKRLAAEAKARREEEERKKEEDADEADKKAKADRMAAEQQANEEWADLLGDI